MRTMKNWKTYLDWYMNINEHCVPHVDEQQNVLKISCSTREEFNDWNEKVRNKLEVSIELVIELTTRCKEQKALIKMQTEALNKMMR